MVYDNKCSSQIIRSSVDPMKEGSTHSGVGSEMKTQVHTIHERAQIERCAIVVQ